MQRETSVQRANSLILRVKRSMGCSSVDAADLQVISEIYRDLNDGVRFFTDPADPYSYIGRSPPIGYGTKRCSWCIQNRWNEYVLPEQERCSRKIHSLYLSALYPASWRTGYCNKNAADSHSALQGSGFFWHINTRISLNNTASLVSAKKIGFQPVEEYQEPSNR